MSTSPWHRSTWHEDRNNPGSRLGHPHYHGGGNNPYDKHLRERQIPFQRADRRAKNPDFAREGARNDYGSCTSVPTLISASIMLTVDGHPGDMRLRTSDLGSSYGSGWSSQPPRSSPSAPTMRTSWHGNNPHYHGDRWGSNWNTPRERQPFMKRAENRAQNIGMRDRYSAGVSISSSSSISTHR